MMACRVVMGTSTYDSMRDSALGPNFGFVSSMFMSGMLPLRVSNGPARRAASPQGVCVFLIWSRATNFADSGGLSHHPPRAARATRAARPGEWRASRARAEGRREDLPNRSGWRKARFPSMCDPEVPCS